jgi:hypothetical protein
VKQTASALVDVRQGAFFQDKLKVRLWENLCYGWRHQTRAALINIGLSGIALVELTPTELDGCSCNAGWIDVCTCFT